MKLCRIFAGGIIADTSFITVDNGDLVICADRGYIYASELGIVPDIIVGDFDSYSEKLPEGVEICRSVPEKDDTDTLLALKLAIERGAEKIILYGALGGRFDHTMANIQTLIYAYKHGCEAVIADADNIIELQAEGERSYPKRDGWYFSVFAVTPELYVGSLSGVKYPLSDYCIVNSFPIGVSNEIISDAAVLEIKKGVALIVRSKQ